MGLKTSRCRAVTCLAMLALLVPSGAALAGTITVTGLVDTTDKLVGCNYWETVPFQVSQTGTYVTSNLLPLYNGSNSWVIWINDSATDFNPGGIDARSDNLTNLPNALNAGTQYYFHVMGSCQEGVIPLNYSFAFQGPGEICLGNAPCFRDVVVPVAAPRGLLLMGLLVALAGAYLIRRA